MRRRPFLLVLAWFGCLSGGFAEIGEINVQVPALEISTPAAPEDHSVLWIRSEARIFLEVVDVKGRRTGVDPKSRQTLEQIPHSQCESDFIRNRYTQAYDALHETITLEPALQGSYRFLITGLQPGPYTILLSGLGRGGSSLSSKEVEGLISEGQKKVFTLNFQPDETNALSAIEEIHKE